MQNQLPTHLNLRIACTAIIGILANSVNAQTRLKWDRDTIVEKEYQASFCQNKPERSAICSDGFSITQSGTKAITIDSIFFKVITSGIISSHATLKFNQGLLKFSYHSSGNQAVYPWKFSEYNDSGHAKITINPFQKAEFTGFEIDNCLFSCPVSGAASLAKGPVTGILIFVSNNNHRDTLTLMGLQRQESTLIYRGQRTGANPSAPEKQKRFRNSKGQLVGLPSSKGKGSPGIAFPSDSN